MIIIAMSNVIAVIHTVCAASVCVSVEAIENRLRQFENSLIVSSRE